MSNSSTSSAADQSGPPCAKCGGPTVLGPGTQTHHASSRCTQCRAFRWLPKPDHLKASPRLLPIRNESPLPCRDCGKRLGKDSGFLYTKRREDPWLICCDECNPFVEHRIVTGPLIVHPMSTD